jgi:hypothetical protein
MPQKLSVISGVKKSFFVPCSMIAVKRIFVENPLVFM